MNVRALSNQIGKLFIVASCLIALPVMAAPTIDSLHVQGYMKKADGNPVTNGTYNLAFGVYQNGVVIWGRTLSTVVSGGLFTKALNGVGGNLSGLPAGTGMNSNFTGATLNASLLIAGGAGAISVRVYAVDPIDGLNPQFDLAVAAVPTAFLAEAAKGVVPGVLTQSSFTPSAVTDSSAGAGDAGKLVLLSPAGLVNANMLPPIPASQIGSGQVTLSSGGTGSADGSITGSGSISYRSAAGSATTLGNNSGTSSVILQSGTGGINASVTGATGNLTMSAGTTSGAITIGNTSSGNSTFGNSGGASVTTLQSGTGHILLSPVGAGLVRLTNGSGLNMVNGTGSITFQSPLNPTSYNFILPSSAGSANQYLKTDGAGITSWATNGDAASGANSDITGLNPPGTLALGGASTTTVQVGGSSATTLNVGSLASGTLTSVIGGTVGASSTAIQSGTGKIRLGVVGSGFTAMGVCTTPSITVTNTVLANQTCAGVPASTNVSISCSGTAAFSAAGRALHVRSSGTAGQINLTLSGTNTTAMTYVCMWMQP